MTRNPGRWIEALKEAGKQPEGDNPREQDVIAAAATHFGDEDSLDATGRRRASSSVSRVRCGLQNYRGDL